MRLMWLLNPLLRLLAGIWSNHNTGWSGSAILQTHTWQRWNACHSRSHETHANITQRACEMISDLLHFTAMSNMSLHCSCLVFPFTRTFELLQVRCMACITSIVAKPIATQTFNREMQLKLHEHKHQPLIEYTRMVPQSKVMVLYPIKIKQPVAGKRFVQKNCSIAKVDINNHDGNVIL